MFNNTQTHMMAELRLHGMPTHRHRLSSHSLDQLPSMLAVAIGRQNKYWFLDRFRKLCGTCSGSEEPVDIWQNLRWRAECRHAIDNGLLIEARLRSGTVSLLTPLDLLCQLREWGCGEFFHQLVKVEQAVPPNRPEIDLRSKTSSGALGNRGLALEGLAA